MNDNIDIVFDDPPSNLLSGRFVEAEDSEGKSFKLGEWVERDDGYWVLRFPDPRRIKKLEAEVTFNCKTITDMGIRLGKQKTEIEALKAVYKEASEYLYSGSIATSIMQGSLFHQQFVQLSKGESDP